MIVENIPYKLDKRHKVLKFSFDFENKITAAIDQCNKRYSQLINNNLHPSDKNGDLSIKKYLPNSKSF